MSSLKSLHFEVYGRVQGVSFRYYTKRKARELGLVGWCRNADMGSVEGVVQGRADLIDVFKQWIRYEGSPASRIDDTRFVEVTIDRLEFEEFAVRR